MLAVESGEVADDPLRFDADRLQRLAVVEASIEVALQSSLLVLHRCRKSDQLPSGGANIVDCLTPASAIRRRVSSSTSPTIDADAVAHQRLQLTGPVQARMPRSISASGRATNGSSSSASRSRMPDRSPSSMS